MNVDDVREQVSGNSELHADAVGKQLRNSLNAAREHRSSVRFGSNFHGNSAAPELWCSCVYCLAFLISPVYIQTSSLGSMTVSKY
jgi:hypothetical protein